VRGGRAAGQDGLVSGQLVAGRSAVVFDFYGTLTPVSPEQVWAQNTARLAAVMGVSATGLSRALDETFADRMTGNLGGVRPTIAALADRLGARLTDAQLDEASQTRRRLQEAMFALRPEALPVLGQLRDRGLKIGLLSDCTTELPDAWPRLPIAAVVDAPVFSCLERTRKPDPRLFRKVAAELDLDPGLCLYVGDGGGDELAGASAVGMRAVLLAGQDWEEGHGPARRVSWPGPRIGSLSELC
jgi:putative hydrolase of the HAD superfamily